MDDSDDHWLIISRRDQHVVLCRCKRPGIG